MFIYIQNFTCPKGLLVITIKKGITYKFRRTTMLFLCLTQAFLADPGGGIA
jgi:hypothetical protein